MAGLYLQYEYHLAATQLALAMAGMGATLALRDFLEVFRRPAALVAGLLLQLALVPLLAVALGGIFALPAGLATGLALVAAVPGGSMSNLFTHLARGNTALSIALTGVTTLACLATTPFLLGLMAESSLPADFAMPRGRIMREILFVLLLPLGFGMLLGHRLPRAREAFSTWCIRGSLFAIALIVVGSAAAGRVDPGAHGGAVLLAMVALPLASQLAVRAASAALGLSSGDATALAIEVTIRNTNLALLITASLFPATGRGDPLADGVFFVALLYGGFALVVATPTVLRGRAERAGSRSVR